MTKASNQQNFFADHFSDEKKASAPAWKWGVFSFVVVFLMGLLFTHSFLQRKVLIAEIKKQMVYSIEALNQFGWDLAYDNVSFNAFPLLPLGELNHVKLYNRYAHNSWNIEKIRFDNSILNTHRLNFEISGKQFLTVNAIVHKLNIEHQDFFIEIDDNQQIDALSLKLFNISIADIADIEQIVVLGNKINVQSVDTLSPSFKLAFEAANLKWNGLLNYPLSQNIRKIYVNSSIIGRITPSDNFRSDLREWLVKDGHITIEDLNISWPPLLLVGKGNLYLNENFKPILQLDTTSKALAILIDDLEKQNWLDSKGVFVAKILLDSKSYKSDEKDEYLTVTTPIALRDDALLIEKIVLKKFQSGR